jgi:replication factor C large subunit
MSDEMWSEKYRPLSLSQIVGNEEAKSTFINWLKRWKTGGKAVLLYGPPGTGKTTLVQVASSNYGFKLIEMNASDVRTKETIMKTAGPIARETSLFKALYNKTGSLLFMDEIDGIFGQADRGGIGSVLKIIHDTKTPVVLAANDPWNPKLKLLRRSCEMIRFYSVRPPKIVALLKRILKEERIEAEEEALRILVEKSKGDVRSAINDLQTLTQFGEKLKKSDVSNLAIRDRQIDVQEALSRIFFAKSVRQAKNALNESRIHYNMLFQTIHDNLPFQYSDSKSLTSAYDSLSRADVFLGRITRTQSWSLLSYALELMTAGVAAANKGNVQKINYNFPPRKILLLGKTKTERKLRKGICERVSAKCHVSTKTANTDFIPYLRVIFKHNEDLASNLASWLALDNEMVESLRLEN